MLGFIAFSAGEMKGDNLKDKNLKKKKKRKLEETGTGIV